MARWSVRQGQSGSTQASGWDRSEAKFRNIVGQTQAGTATGLDVFPASLLKNRGPKRCLVFLECLSDMLETGQIPQD